MTCYFGSQVIVEQLGVLLTDTLVDIAGNKNQKQDEFTHSAVEKGHSIEGAFTCV